MALQCSSDSPGFASGVPSLNPLSLEEAHEVIDVWGKAMCSQAEQPLSICPCHWQNHGVPGWAGTPCCECGVSAARHAVLARAGKPVLLSKAVCETGALSPGSFVDTKVKKYLKTIVVVVKE